MKSTKITISDVLFAYITMINLEHGRNIKIYKYSVPMVTSWSLYEDYQSNFFIRLMKEMDNTDPFEPKKKYTLDFSDKFFNDDDYSHVAGLFSSSEEVDGYTALSTYDFKVIRKALNEIINIIPEILENRF